MPDKDILSIAELDSVHSVKILLCYILDRLDRPVTEEQLLAVSEDSGVINYFYFSDALEELIENGSIRAEACSENGAVTARRISITEKGRLGSEYFNRNIPLVFRRKLLKAAFSFFAKLEREAVCGCEVSDLDDGCSVDFTLTDGSVKLIDMSFYAPDRAQAEMIAEKIRSNPMNAYKNILGLLLDNPEEQIDVDKYL